ncbi:eukaryotic translation initiation factor 3 subunit A-like [Panicum virgatum]|uniref:Uncharacterized protein n=1 Tax=Panicum virgatum TaxID=38727 RepID=A0A8T0NBD0_PANVG|nr:eukaryotic translation initiation factor 3 subunit A-like [Panicum virgatum]KAG2546730.1 hypothetical protein PVAP13_9KG041300 [Panicum virgatum]
MDAAPGVKPRREPPPVPPNYVSLRRLQELRLKEKEEQERRRREEEEAAARQEAERRRREEEEAAARREAERAAAIKREAALKVEAKGRAVSREASGGSKERHRRGGQVQGQGNQSVAVAHIVPATAPWPMGRRQGAGGKNEAAIGGVHGEKGPDDAPHGGGTHRVKGKWKGKGKEKLAEALPASSRGGKPENKSESKAKGKGPGDQAAESSSSDGPGEPADAAILPSRGRFRRGRPTGAGGRSAETCAGIAPEKAAGPPPPPGAKSDDMGKLKPSAPRRADVMSGSSDSPDGMKAAPAQAPPPSAADGSSKPTSGGELRETTEEKPRGLVEGQRRRQVVDVHAVAELNPRGARCSARPWRGRGNEATEQHGRVWVPKAAATGSSAGAGL